MSTPLDSSETGRTAHKQRERQFVSALAKGLDILRCFDRPGLELTVSDVARRVGLNQSTAWRLCYTLIECGYLVRASNGSALRVGAAAVTLGYAAVRGLGLPALAEPHLREITQRTTLTTTLSLRHESEMVSVQQVDGRFVLSDQPVGWRALLTSTASGLAVLAAMDDATRDAAMRAIHDREPTAWSRRLARIDAALRVIEADGYIVREDIAGGQYAAVAAAFVEPSPAGARYWALTCGGVRALFDAGHMRAAGRELVTLRSYLQAAVATESVD